MNDDLNGSSAAASFDTLEKAVALGALTDLHTHLMGMGTAEFWVDRVMRVELPKTASVSFRAAMKVICDRIDPAVETCPTIPGVEPTPILKLLKTPGPIVQDLAKHGLLHQSAATLSDEDFANDLALDVVYPLSSLCVGFDINNSAYLEFRLGNCMSGIDEIALTELESLLFNRHVVNSPGCSFKDNVAAKIVFDFRDHEFKRIVGIPNGYFVKLMATSTNNFHGDPTEEAKAIRAHLKNCFAMLNPDGSNAQFTDLRSFRAQFTPQFYPRRFKLKDPIYEQRPDVLSHLLNEVLDNYAHAGVNYVELSFSLSDLMNPTIVRHLKGAHGRGAKKNRRLSTPANTAPGAAANEDSDEEGEEEAAEDGGKEEDHGVDDEPEQEHEENPSESRLEAPTEVQKKRKLKKRPFPRARTAMKVVTNVKPDKLIWKYLAAVSRCFKHPDPLTDPLHAMLKDISLRDGSSNNNEFVQIVSDEFCKTELIEKWWPDLKVNKPEDDDKPIRRLPWGKRLLRILSRDEANPANGSFDEVRSFLFDNVVGFDLVGDERGYPLCPFVHPTITKSIRILSNANPAFGVRLHAGEGAPRGSSAVEKLESSLVHRYFLIHLSTTIQALKILKKECPHLRFRIGHGIGFLDKDLASSLKWLYDNKVAIEINLTSNYTLLADSFHHDGARHNDVIDALRQFLIMEYPIVLGTDDDGVWPIPLCKIHGVHRSVAAKFCRAIHLRAFANFEMVSEVIQNGSKFAFDVHTSKCGPLSKGFAMNKDELISAHSHLVGITNSRNGDQLKKSLAAGDLRNRYKGLREAKRDEHFGLQQPQDAEGGLHAAGEKSQADDPSPAELKGKKRKRESASDTTKFDAEKEDEESSRDPKKPRTY